MGEYAADILARIDADAKTAATISRSTWQVAFEAKFRPGSARKKTKNKIAAFTASRPSSSFAAAGCEKQTPTLSLLVWEGYADPSFVRAFEESHNCKISASYMGSSDELVAKLRGGSASNYDVISPSSDVATMIASSGLAAPLDLSKLPVVRAALAAPAQHAARPRERQRVRRAVHVGTQSPALRQLRFHEAAR